ncbi:MAG: hypothetical protein P4L91_04720 [Burkholderiaceae bacterium]|nr:hypothetical protein [Burkholderiaceae bacterium]
MRQDPESGRDGPNLSAPTLALPRQQSLSGKRSSCDLIQKCPSIRLPDGQQLHAGVAAQPRIGVGNTLHVNNFSVTLRQLLQAQAICAFLKIGLLHWSARIQSTLSRYPTLRIS